jgi:hypothetical protein
MAQVGKGFGQRQATQPVLAEGRALKRANADNPAVAQPGATAAVRHDGRSGIDKAASATRRLAPSSHGGLQGVTDGLPASARPPQRAK